MTPSTIALLGLPNTGKSTFFNRIAAARARVGNWPGITVDLAEAEMSLNGERVKLVDLPGIYDLAGTAADETIVREFFQRVPVRLVLVILNASQIQHQLRLALQVKAWGLPMVVLLNMADEAGQLGIEIDTAKLSDRLGVPVVALSAKYGGGYWQAYETICHALKEAPIPQGPLLQPTLPELDSGAIAPLLADTVTFPSRTVRRLTEQLDDWLLHPLWGLPLFFGGLYLVFQVVWVLGLGLQGWLSDTFEAFQGQVLEPVFAGLPPLLSSLLLEGLYGGITTVAAFVPLVTIFFIVMAIVEDSGYLARAAYLMDGLMARLGLDGRSFVLGLMGFGCNVPALMATRIIRSPGLRLLTMLIIPFSLCSARLQVFVFLIACLFPPQWGAAVLVSLYGWSILAALFTALCFQGYFPNTDPFLLELPPYRWPTAQQVILRAWGEVRHFLSRATGFIMMGVLVVWALTHLPLNATPSSPETWAGRLGTALQPLLAPVGITPELTIALIVGFVAKEIVIGALAVIYHLSGTSLQQAIAQDLTPLQAYSFMLFTLLYTPCLSTLATLWSESKRGPLTIFATLYALGIAWLVSGAVYQLGHWWGWG
ncbi:ferrous iron transport protein B [Thermosynechococcus vestitus]|uniref:Ferrous iron transport protein B n=1 Tax=Thermosynechococcus vestitus (strain NIES-2133 / IAM M-273 / BP-1) TaxID=197221 RepID=Q8DIY3_THEVB|nr:ferrous iron transport protein B [Thermosynechococcus vestitus]BAC09000.1 ferrous iron transport protein B [Thermosynechococcus vestitus BP-1]